MAGKKGILSVLEAISQAKREAEAAIAAEKAGKKMSKAELEKSGYYHPIGTNKLKVPASQMSRQTIDDPRFQAQPTKYLTPKDLVGKVGIPYIGDRADTGKILTHINDIELPEGVELEGGRYFGKYNTYPDQPKKSSAWASDKAVINKLVKQSKIAAEGGKEVLGINVLGSPTNVNFNNMVTKALFGQLDLSALRPADIAEFNAVVRKAYPRFKGIDHPEALEQLTAPGMGNMRKKVVETMDQSKFQGAGFPDVASTRAAVTEPALMDVPTGSAGLSIAKINPENLIVEDPIIQHGTYPVHKGGEYGGEFELPMDFRDIFTDFTDARRLLGDKLPKDDLRSMSFQSPAIQEFDDDWLNRIMPTYEQIMKSKAYAKGGKVGKASKVLSEIEKAYEEAKVAKELAPLSEADFHKKYVAQHKDVRNVTQEDREAAARAILESGFNKGFNVNALPVDRGGRPTDVIQKRYGNKAGDKVYLLPREGILDSENGLITAAGYVPNPMDVLDIAVDREPSYEAYLRNFKKKYATGGKVDMEAEFKKADTIGMAEGGYRPVVGSPYGKGSGRPVTPQATFPDMSTLALTGKILARKGKEQLKKELANPSPQMAVDILGNLAADIVGMPSDMIEGAKGEPMKLHPNVKQYGKVKGIDSTMQRGKGKPMLGSENLYAQLKNAGITSGTERPLTETALSLLSPAAIAKGPKLLKAMENLPVGLSIKDVSEGAEEAKRVANFVSSVEKTIKGHKMDSMPGEQWANWMRANASKGAKKEAEATGLYEWLKTQPKATKADIEAYVEGNLPKINVVEKGDLKLSKDESKELDTLKEKANKYMFGDKDAMTDDEFLRYNRLASIYDESTVGGLNQKAESYFRAARDAKQRGLKIDEIHGNNLGEFYKRRADALNAAPIDANKAKYGRADLVLPGGKNYKETMLTLPAKPMSFEEYVNYNMPGTRNPENYREDYLRYLSNPDRNSLKENFRSGHYDEPNILAHLRANERLTPDQKRVLFLEELQSDWAQQGREKGFGLKAMTTDEYQELNDLAALKYPMSHPYAEPVSKLSAEQELRYNELLNKEKSIKDFTPDAPYVTDTKDWTALGLKHALKKAVDEGQDYLAWTSGAQQADRYDLSKQVSRIEYHPESGDLIAYKEGEPRIVESTKDAKELSNLIGKEAADKLINSEVGKNGFKILEGDDLRIGGEGMKGYYDQIVPQTMNDILKQYGVKDGVKEVGIELHPSQIASDYESLELTGRSPGDVIKPGKYSQQMGIEITPELRERILSEGLPHFKRGGQPKSIDLETQFRLADILTR